jgi:ribosome assembly protein YihI (activator of Der GTPase)
MKTWIESQKKNNSKKKKREPSIVSKRCWPLDIKKKKKKKKKKKTQQTVFPDPFSLFIRNKDSFFKIIIIVNDGVDDENVYEYI